MGIQSFFDYPTRPDSETTQTLEFLPNWDEHKWEKLLAYTTTRSFRAGDHVIRIGDTDRSFYIIIEGKLEVLLPTRGGQKVQSIRTFSERAIVGELAFIDGSPRSATIRALTDGKMLQMTVDSFEVFSVREPELAKETLFELARILSSKLRHANEFISKWVK